MIESGDHIQRSIFKLDMMKPPEPSSSPTSFPDSGQVAENKKATKTCDLYINRKLG